MARSFRHWWFNDVIDVFEGTTLTAIRSPESSSPDDRRIYWGVQWSSRRKAEPFELFSWHGQPCELAEDTLWKSNWSCRKISFIKPTKGTRNTASVIYKNRDSCSYLCMYSFLLCSEFHEQNIFYNLQRLIKAKPGSVWKPFKSRRTSIGPSMMRLITKEI